MYSFQQWRWRHTKHKSPLTIFHWFSCCFLSFHHSAFIYDVTVFNCILRVKSLSLSLLLTLFICFINKFLHVAMNVYVLLWTSLLKLTTAFAQWLSFICPYTYMCVCVLLHKRGLSKYIWMNSQHSPVYTFLFSLRE